MLSGAPEPVVTTGRLHRWVEFAAFRFDCTERTLFREGTEVPLLPKAGDFLDCLLREPGNIVSKDMLLTEVWGDAFVSETALFQVVSHLRRALGDDAKAPEIIETVHKRGYRLIAPVTAMAEPAAHESLRSQAGARPSYRMLAAWTVVCVGIGGMLAAAVMTRSGPGAQSALRLEIPIQLPAPICACTQPNLALSPDGTQLVYLSHEGRQRDRLFLMSLVDHSRRPVPLTSGTLRTPFFSPDGKWVGYFQDRWLYKIAVQGGSPVQLAEVAASRSGGASWGADGTIIYSLGPGSGLWAVSEIGGEGRRLTAPSANSDEYSHLWPEHLPGGQAVLFTVATKGMGEAGEGRLEALSLESGERTAVVASGGTTPTYSTSGHVLFVRHGTLMSLRFDPRSLAASGPAVPVLDDLLVWPESPASFALSDNDVLVYLPGRTLENDAELIWVDRKGNQRDSGLGPVTAVPGAVSPDGTKLALARGGDIWVYDLARDTLARVTSAPSDETEPLWNLDGTALTFSSNRNGPYEIFSKEIDSSAVPRRLFSSPGDAIPESWSVDTGLLAISLQDQEAGWSLATFAPDRDPQVQALNPAPFAQASAKFSPDGRWVAYVSSETGSAEVFVETHPRSGRRLQVSYGGGMFPVWSDAGEEVFFSRGAEVWVVRVADGDSLEPGRARLLYAVEGTISGLARGRARDELLVTVRRQEQTQGQLNLVLHWLAKPPGESPGED